MHSRHLSIVVGLVTVFAACGGTIVQQNGDEPPDGGPDAKSSPGTDSGRDTSTEPPDAPLGCTEVVLTADDLACTKDSDCTQTTSGKICEETCGCGGTAVNNAAASRVETQVSGLEHGDCHCPAFGTPTCVDHACALCGGGFAQPAGCTRVDCTFDSTSCDGGKSDARSP